MLLIGLLGVGTAGRDDSCMAFCSLFHPPTLPTATAHTSHFTNTIQRNATSIQPDTAKYKNAQIHTPLTTFKPSESNKFPFTDGVTGGIFYLHR